MIARCNMRIAAIVVMELLIGFLRCVAESEPSRVTKEYPYQITRSDRQVWVLVKIGTETARLFGVEVGYEELDLAGAKDGYEEALRSLEKCTADDLPMIQSNNVMRWSAAVQVLICTHEAEQLALDQARQQQATAETVVKDVVWRYRIKPDDTAEICKRGEEAALSRDLAGAIHMPCECDGHKVTSIGVMAFSGCSNLVALTISPDVREIKSGALKGCERLKDVFFEGDEMPMIADDVFDGCHQDLIIHVPRKWNLRSQILVGRQIWREELLPGDVCPEVMCPYDISEHELAYDGDYYGISVKDVRLPYFQACDQYGAAYSKVVELSGSFPTFLQTGNVEKWQKSVCSRFHVGDGNVGEVVTVVQKQEIQLSVSNWIALVAKDDVRAAKFSYENSGLVNVVTEVKGGIISIPPEWSGEYPAFNEKFGSDFTKALAMKTGKKDGAGNDMFVWQDYVAGTDPTKEDDVFTASITIVDGEVKVSYSPELDDARKALRKYTTWGKKSLLDTGWVEVEPGQEGDYNFFKVTVEMK